MNDNGICQVAELEVGQLFVWQRAAYKVMDHISFKGETGIDRSRVVCIARQDQNDVWYTNIQGQENFNPYCEVQLVKQHLDFIPFKREA
jgi:hypothetical protein